MYLFFCVLREKLSLSKINTWLATEFQWQAVLLLYGVPIPDNVAIYQRHINRTA